MTGIDLYQPGVVFFLPAAAWGEAPNATSLSHRRNRLTFLQQVTVLLTERRGRWCCDFCLMNALNHSTLQSVHTATDALALQTAYDRGHDLCEECKRLTLVTKEH